MAGPRNPSERAAAGNAQPQPIGNYYFTFGGDHLLRHGRVVLGDLALGGLPLAPFFVLVHARSEGEARARMGELFGNRYDSVYANEAGSHMVRRYGLRSLLDTGPTSAMEELVMCGCGTPEVPHGIGWHTEYDDPSVTPWH
jgi:hypothetical protein